MHHQDNFEFVEGIFDLCAHAKRCGFFIFVVSNQAGIGRGYFTEQDFLSLTQWMCDEFRKRSAAIDKVYFCPFHAEVGIGRYKIDSPFRKPAPGMILEAAKEFPIALESSLLVGDKNTDIQAGQSAGVGFNVLFRPTSDRQQEGRIIPDVIVDRLSEVIKLIN